MPKLHLGTIGWSYNFWKGNFYPEKIISKKFLDYYSKQFNTVEVDATFYRNPTEETIKNWFTVTPEGFVFSIKFPQLITHIKRLQDSQIQTDSFLNRVALLKEKLGPLLLQFPPTFAAKHFQDLERYLKRLPEQHRYVVEVRNKSWLTSEFYNLLREYRVVLAWAESPLMPGISEMTGDFLYVRWEGNRQAVVGTFGKVEVNKKTEYKHWAEKLGPHLAKTEVFGYFGKYFSGFPPYDIANMNALLRVK
jgi:uncharacterized protein YecE (DUF72 family)